MANNPEQPSKRLFPEEWKEAWRKLEERVRHRPGPRCGSAGMEKGQPANGLLTPNDRLKCPRAMLLWQPKFESLNPSQFGFSGPNSDNRTKGNPGLFVLLRTVNGHMAIVA